MNGQEVFKRVLTQKTVVLCSKSKFMVNIGAKTRM